MASQDGGAGKPPNPESRSKLDDIVAKARKGADQRMLGYREQSLRLYPWVCARCGREFTRENLHELTVHHKDHNHDNNPPDGGNWENLCLYCHDWEHQKYSQQITGEDASFGVTAKAAKAVTHNPFANLKDLLSPDKK